MSCLYLNVGCGSNFHSAWVNIDIYSAIPEVISHDIRQGLPFHDNNFDACYSSHVIEHLTPAEAEKLLAECFRVLKPNGVIRVVVPDLESIVRIYLQALEQVEAGNREGNPNLGLNLDPNPELNYDWIMLELYDQAVRSYSGGRMGEYLSAETMPNRAFAISRLGVESENYWDKKAKDRSIWAKVKSQRAVWLIRKLRISIAKIFVTLIAGKQVAQAFDQGIFRSSGEIHRWMYDRSSLRRILQQAGFTDIKLCQAYESRIPNFNDYELDVIAGKVRKPDSLFMEGLRDK